MKTWRIIAVALLGACVTLAVRAHAFLDHGDPRVGSTVSAAPAEVRLWFNEEIESAFSSLKVLDAAGHAVDKGDAHVDAAERAMLRVSLQSLGPGTYTVQWRVVSVDTHVTKGSFAFQVKP